MANEDDQLSLIAPVGYNHGRCGYCGPHGKRSPTKSSRSYGIWAYDMTAHTYQRLIDDGWRRSGSYTYKPDNLRTCCAQHPIRLRVDEFRASRSLRRTLTEAEEVLRRPTEAAKGVREVAARVGDGRGATHPRQSSRHRGKYNVPWRLEERMRSLVGEGQGSDKRVDEGDATLFGDPMGRAQKAHAHRVKVKQRKGAGEELGVEEKRFPLTRLKPPLRRRLEALLVPPASTDEKYALFRAYQRDIHGEAEGDISSRKGFERFLCESPFRSRGKASRGSAAVDVDSAEPIPYGLYHMEWRLDGELVAVGVLDILPLCVSSVYLFYDPRWGELQLGKLSALREILLVMQLGRKRGMQDLRYYYMGYYIHSCTKMRYKASYVPCSLLDMATRTWVPYDRAKVALDKGARTDFERAAQNPAESDTRAYRPSLEDSKRSEARPKAEEADGNEDLHDEKEEHDDEEDDVALPMEPPPPGFEVPDEDRLAGALVLDAAHQELGLMPWALLELRRDRGIASTSPTSRGGRRVQQRQLTECVAALAGLAERFVFLL